MTSPLHLKPDFKQKLPRIVGRSSSDFTRVARIFASEAGVDYAFDVVRDLMSLDTSDYAGNPALKIPILETSEGGWFGALNVSRVLARMSTKNLDIVWPEDLRLPMLANAQELAVQAMATEVGLIMSGLGGASTDGPHQIKMRASMAYSMAWLDAHIEPMLAALPLERTVSYLEVTLFCLITHLEFRSVLDVSPYSNLIAFREGFGQRTSARETPYLFD